MGRSNKRVDVGTDLDMEMPKKKGTSYQRKQEDERRLSKDKKRSKRLTAHSDSERARSREAIHNYMSGDFDEDDF